MIWRSGAFSKGGFRRFVFYEAVLMMKKQFFGLVVFGGCLFWGSFAICRAQSGEEAFRQLEELLPTPNVYRTASGGAGAELLAAARGL